MVNFYIWVLCAGFGHVFMLRIVKEGGIKRMKILFLINGHFLFKKFYFQHHLLNFLFTS
jgi:hypothetical protein